MKNLGLMGALLKDSGPVVLGLAAAMMSGSALAHSADRAQVWLTTGDQSHLMERQGDIAFTPATNRAGAQVITIDPAHEFQSIEGFGAAMTDASAYVLAHDMDKGQRRAVMRELFGPHGLHLDFMRLTIGASDFSMRDYSYDDMPAGARDTRIAHFTLAPARKDLLPVLQEARAANPQLHFMASPWSAPGWMKTSGSMIGGTLRGDAEHSFALYLTAYVQAMAHEGVPIAAITVQNEPGFSPADYPGMLLPPAARADFIGQHLGPMFARRHMTTRILDYDHNWDHPESPMEVLNDPQASRYIAGVAWHCYGGDVPAQSKIHDAFPRKDTYFTECSGGGWVPVWDEAFGGMMRNLVIGATRNWAKTVLLWNLALDESNGPHLGGCTDCRGVVTVNSKTGAITRNLEYYALSHISRFVRRGARRIASTSSAGGVEDVAFRNPDGSLVLVAYNAGTAPAPISMLVGGRQANATIPARSAVTYFWP